MTEAVPLGSTTHENLNTPENNKSRWDRGVENLSLLKEKVMSGKRKTDAWAEKYPFSFIKGFKDGLTSSPEDVDPAKIRGAFDRLLAGNLSIPGLAGLKEKVLDACSVLAEKAGAALHKAELKIVELRDSARDAINDLKIKAVRWRLEHKVQKSATLEEEIDQLRKYEELLQKKELLRKLFSDGVTP